MPSSSVQVDVAEAMVTEITAATFSQTIDTVRRQWGELDFSLETAAGEYVVDIVPYNVITRLACRSDVGYMVSTSICLRKKFTRSEQNSSGEILNSEVDKCFVLLQELHDFFCPSQSIPQSGRRLSALPEAAWQEGGEILAPYAQYLKEMSQFVGVVRVLYYVVRPPNTVS